MFCLFLLLFLVGVRVELKKFLKESLKEVIPAIENLDTQPYSKDIDRKYIKISICPGACMAFIGSDVCDLRRCKFCNLKRYSPCTYLSCRYRNYDDCPHRDDVKTPKKNVFYRPLLPLLKDLLETKYFSDYCSHALKYVTANPWRAGEEYVYSDLLSGKEAQKHVVEMHEQFLRYRNALSEIEDIVEVSLIASDDYDGVEMMKRTRGFQYFWPLFISFVSLPPSLRGKYGIGSFFAGFNTTNPGSRVENFLFRDCFVPELQKFEEGVRLQVNGKNYFIQIRLLVHVYDTKAKEKLERFSGTNSYGGCIKCRGNPGMYVS